MFLSNDAFDFSKLAQDLTRPGALSLDQLVSNPSANPDVQNEIDYLGRDAQAEIDDQNALNQSDWSGLPQNQAVQNEIDFYASQSGWSVF
jgi:hypothetical protein